MRFIGFFIIVLLLITAVLSDPKVKAKGHTVSHSKNTKGHTVSHSKGKSISHSKKSKGNTHSKVKSPKKSKQLTNQKQLPLDLTVIINYLKSAIELEKKTFKMVQSYTKNNCIPGSKGSFNTKTCDESAQTISKNYKACETYGDKSIEKIESLKNTHECYGKYHGSNNCRTLRKMGYVVAGRLREDQTRFIYAGDLRPKTSSVYKNLIEKFVV